MPQWHSMSGDAGLQAGMEIAKVCNLSQNPPFFETYPTFRLHYIDYALPQVYNAFVIIVPCKR